MTEVVVSYPLHTDLRRRMRHAVADRQRATQGVACDPPAAGALHDRLLDQTGSGR